MFLQILNEEIIYGILFYGIPLIIAVLFGVSLFLYIRARMINKKYPDHFPKNVMRNKLIFLIVTSALFGILLFITISFVAMLGMAIAFM